MFFRPFRSASIVFVTVAFAVTACQKLTPQQSHFERGYKAYNAGDFATALLYLKPLVESGHPAAQLLVAKMYAKGEGVPEDMEKAELLRNLAAFQVYKRKDLTPGEVRPANETLATISDRLDYYVGAGEGKKAPTQDLNQVLQSVDVKGLTDLQKIDGEQGASNSVAIDIPHEPIKGDEPQAQAQPEAEPDQPSSGADETPMTSVVPTSDRAPEREKTPQGDSRRSDQITLSLVRQAAQSGDVQAMDLLSAAYTKGFYGLTPSTTQAMFWSGKVKEASRYGVQTSDIDPMEKVPFAQVWGIIGAGIALVAAGIWRWRQTR